MYYIYYASRRRLAETRGGTGTRRETVERRGVRGVATSSSFLLSTLKQRTLEASHSLAHSLSLSLSGFLSLPLRVFLRVFLRASRGASRCLEAGAESREQFGRVQLSRVYCCRSLFSSLLSRMYCIALEQVRPDELVYRCDEGRTARGTGPARRGEARRGEARRGSPFWRATLAAYGL